MPSTTSIKIDGSRFHVMVDGSRGTPLLLINGLGADLQSWSAFAAALGNRRVVMFDLPDDCSLPPVRMPGQARRIGRVLDALGIDQVHVLGYSWGGALAQQFAKDMPSRVRSLVLVATNVGVGSAPLSPGPMLRLVAGRSKSEETLSGFTDLLLGRSVRRKGRRSPAGWVSNSASYVQQLFAFVGWSSVPWLYRLASPTLIIVGDQDPLVPVCTARLLRHSIRGSHLSVLTGAGHSFMLTPRATEAAALVQDFLAVVEETDAATDADQTCDTDDVASTPSASADSTMGAASRRSAINEDRRSLLAKR